MGRPQRSKAWGTCEKPASVHPTSIPHLGLTLVCGPHTGSSGPGGCPQSMDIDCLWVRVGLKADSHKALPCTPLPARGPFLLHSFTASPVPPHRCCMAQAPRQLTRYNCRLSYSSLQGPAFRGGRTLQTGALSRTAHNSLCQLWPPPASYLYLQGMRSHLTPSRRTGRPIGLSCSAHWLTAPGAINNTQEAQRFELPIAQ